MTGRTREPRILLVSMYPLDAGRWGPTVRIARLRDELARLVRLDVIDGYRGARRARLARYAASGRLRGLDGVYVETSTFLPAETDLGFLGLARSLGVPVLTYLRDAYQLFPDAYPTDTWRKRLASRVFRPMARALRAVSTRIAVPTAGLGHAIFGADASVELLPPGAPPPVTVARDPDATDLLLVGDARLPANGADRLLAAVNQARASGVSVGVTIVTRPGGEPAGDLPPWARIERGETDEIHRLLPSTIASVIPRPRSPYNDLALPIKLFDYLSYGRPLLVTDCTEQAGVVRQADAGIVTGDDPDAIADGIRRLAGASAEQRERWSENARVAAHGASWEHRARTVLELLRIPA